MAKRRWLARFADRIIPFSFYLSVVGTAGVGLLGYYVIERTAESEAWVVHTAVTIAKLERLHVTITEAESAGRLFLIRADPGSRARYSRWLASIDDQLREFRKLTADNATQQAAAAELEQKVATRFAYLDGLIGVRVTRGLAGGEKAGIGAGIAEMERITDIVSRMKDTEYRLLDERMAVRERQNFWLRVGLIVLVAIGIVLLAVVYGFMSRVAAARAAAEARALHLAHHDTLTGLPNRRLLQDRMSIALAHAKRNQIMLAVLCLDLDGFKKVNDTLGHDAGDALLKQVSQRLGSALRSEDTVSRLGGDEFVVMLPTVKSPEYGEVVAAKIIQCVSEPYSLDGAPARIGTSVGIALYPRDGTTQEELLKAADEALYASKAAGKGRYTAAAKAA